MQHLLTTHKWVPWVKHAQLITLLVILQLICYVLLYGFCVFPHGVNVISLTPKFAISVCKLHIAPLLIYHQRTFSFQISHESRNAHFGRDCHHYMYMIWTYFAFYYFNSFPFTQLSYDFSYLFSLLIKKYFPPVFWRKHYMVLAIPFCVC